uniref:Uncharacterized protein n=7 Tax=Aegilops tauschii subsp. strangulata TaxID=200361 RepID=A0A453M4K2_AEGTS
MHFPPLNLLPPEICTDVNPSAELQPICLNCNPPSSLYYLFFISEDCTTHTSSSLDDGLCRPSASTRSPRGSRCSFPSSIVSIFLGSTGLNGMPATARGAAARMPTGGRKNRGGGASSWRREEQGRWHAGRRSGVCGRGADRRHGRTGAREEVGAGRPGSREVGGRAAPGAGEEVGGWRRRAVAKGSGGRWRANEGRESGDCFSLEDVREFGQRFFSLVNLRRFVFAGLFSFVTDGFLGRLGAWGRAGDSAGGFFLFIAAEHEVGVGTKKTILGGTKIKPETRTIN